MKRKNLRRVSVLALVITLLFNTLGAQAITEKAPDIIVSGYWGLVNAISSLKSGSVIGVKGTIEIQLNTMLGEQGKSFTIRRMAPDAKLVFNYYNDSIEGSSTAQNIHFDGNASNVGGTEPFLEINHTVSFDACRFEDCVNISGNGGAISIINRDVSFRSCVFESNSASYGSHIYSSTDGVLNFEYCKFIDGWADEAGGALYLGSGTTTYLRNSTITDNHARIGGGIFNNGYLDISESLIYENEAPIQGADIASEGSLVNHTTDVQYNQLLKEYGLYYAGWHDDTNTSIGGAGDYLKFLTTTEDPNAPTPTEPPVEETPDPTPPEETPPTDEGGNSQPPVENEEDPPHEDNPEEEIPDNPQPPQNGDDTTPPKEEPQPPKNEDEDKDKDKDTSPAPPVVDKPNNTTNNSTTNNHTSTDHSKSEDNTRITENSNNSSTVNHYYTTEVKKEVIEQPSNKEAVNGSNSPSVQSPTPNTNNSVQAVTEANTSPTEGAKDNILSGNVKIDAKSIDLIFEVTDEGYNISINANKQEEKAEAVPVMATPQHEENKEKEIDWMQIITVVLLAGILVLQLRKPKQG